jgi:hypothetical protein
VAIPRLAQFCKNSVRLQKDLPMPPIRFGEVKHSPRSTDRPFIVQLGQNSQVSRKITEQTLFATEADKDTYAPLLRGKDKVTIGTDGDTVWIHQPQPEASYTPTKVQDYSAEVTPVTPLRERSEVVLAQKMLAQAQQAQSTDAHQPQLIPAAAALFDEAFRKHDIASNLFPE